MSGTDQRPFGPHLLDSPQQKLAERSGLLDLSEHRLDHLLAQAIAAAIAGAPELGAHPGDQRAGLCPPLCGGGLVSVLLSSGRDVTLDPPSADSAKIGGRAIASIAIRHRHEAAAVFGRLGKGRFELVGATRRTQILSRKDGMLAERE